MVDQYSQPCEHRLSPRHWEKMSEGGHRINELEARVLLLIHFSLMLGPHLQTTIHTLIVQHGEKYVWIVVDRGGSSKKKISIKVD